MLSNYLTGHRCQESSEPDLAKVAESSLHAMLLTICGLQSFFQRCQNYVQKTVIEQIPMRLTRGNQRQFMRESGLRVRSYEQGFSTSVASIFAADWAIEYPHPVSPRVHVSLLAPLITLHRLPASWHASLPAPLLMPLPDTF